MKQRYVIITLVLGCAIVAGLGLVIVVLSPAARWNYGLWLGQKDYDYIVGLRNSFEQNPTNLVILDEIIARTKSSNSFQRGNAIGVLTQLSYYNTATGRQIHAQALLVSVRALDEDDQSLKHTGLEGLENLGPYAVSAIPNIKKKLSDPDPVIQKEAQEALDEVGKFQTNSSTAAPDPN